MKLYVISRLAAFLRLSGDCRRDMTLPAQPTHGFRASSCVVLRCADCSASLYSLKFVKSPFRGSAPPTAKPACMRPKWVSFLVPIPLILAVQVAPVGGQTTPTIYNGTVSASPFVVWANVGLCDPPSGPIKPYPGNPGICFGNPWQISATGSFEVRVQFFSGSMQTVVTVTGRVTISCTPQGARDCGDLVGSPTSSVERSFDRSCLLNGTSFKCPEILSQYCCNENAFFRYGFNGRWEGEISGSSIAIRQQHVPTDPTDPEEAWSLSGTGTVLSSGPVILSLSPNIATIKPAPSGSSTCQPGSNCAVSLEVKCRSAADNTPATCAWKLVLSALPAEADLGGHVATEHDSKTTDEIGELSAVEGIGDATVVFRAPQVAGRIRIAAISSKPAELHARWRPCGCKSARHGARRGS